MPAGMSAPPASIRLVALEPDAGQASVLAHRAGALLVTGGAGSGKSWVLRERFARLIEEGADPERVALVVRSKSARAEARKALLLRLGRSLPDLRVVTVHALSFDIVGRRYEDLDYREPPTILNAADQFARVQELLAAEDPAHWPAYSGMLSMRGFADEVRQFLLRAQESLLTPDAIEKRAKEAKLTGWLELAAFYRRYLQGLDDEDAVDYAGLVEQAASAAAEAEPLFDHVLVDDYQDATFATESLLAALRPESLVVAGDSDAHIFSFQGTTDAPIRGFPEKVTGSSIVELRETHRAPAGGPSLHAWFAPHTSEEHAAIARELRRIHIEDDVPWGRLAVIVRRQGSHLGGLLRALDDAGVPRTTPESSASILAEPAGYPFILALRWLVRRGERDGLIESLLTSELAGLSPATARGLLRAARAEERAPAEALARTDMLDDAERERVVALRDVLEACEPLSGSIVDAFAQLWQELPYAKRLVDADDRASLDAVMALADAVTRAGERGDPSVTSFLEALEAGDAGPGLASGVLEPAAVSVLTAHGAAGTEFDTVIVAGTVEGNFPSLSRPEPMFDLASLAHRIPQAERNRLRLEDERRLFRMVIGRAKRRVVFTASSPHGADTDLEGHSRLVDELSIDWEEAPTVPGGEPLTAEEAAAMWRRTLADPDVPAAQRLGALEGLVALGAGVDPQAWWFQRDWTEPVPVEVDPEEPIEPLVSYSSLSTLENCELQYALAKELGLDGRSGYHAWVGSLVHALIEDVEKGVVERDPDAMIAEVDRRWNVQEFPSRAVSEAFRRATINSMIPLWWETYGGAPALETEIGFAFPFEGTKVRGYIDRIGPVQGDGVQITDYKTGKSRNAERANENLQLGIYYLAVERAPELEGKGPVKSVELAFVRERSKRDGDMIRLGKAIRPNDADAYREGIEARLGGLVGALRDHTERGSAMPNPLAACRFCDFKTLCSLYPEGQPVFPVESLTAKADA